MGRKGKKRKADDGEAPNPKRKKRPADDMENIIKETDYYFKDDLRHVVPYKFDFTSFCKGRWVGKKLVDVFTKELTNGTRNYYEQAITDGRILVNGKQVDVHYVCKNHDEIVHRVHRHEPPVKAESVPTIHDEDGVVVVNKPASIPIHPSGRFRHNTLLFILARQEEYRVLFTINRLDRMTSGVFIMARSSEKANELSAQLRSGDVHKTYLARVIGEFPSEKVVVNEPIKVVRHHSAGVNVVHPDGKDAVTEFERKSFDGHSSVVYCRPRTGRTHQIRVHLAFLGFPIANDPLYREQARGSPTTELNKSNVKEARAAAERSGRELASMVEGAPEVEQPVLDEAPTTSGEVPRAGSPAPQNDEGCQYIDLPEEYKVDGCKECEVQWIRPTGKTLEMWLHCLKYEGPGWMYEAPEPAWAALDFDARAVCE